MEILKAVFACLTCFCLLGTDGTGKYQNDIKMEAVRHGIPIDIAVRLVAVESSFRPCVESKAGAIHIAFSYLEDLVEQYGDWRLALSAYNMGPGNMEKRGYPVTDYARKIYGD
jgi:soluble lytic murein transglycosylase-like protein